MRKLVLGTITIFLFSSSIASEQLGSCEYGAYDDTTYVRGGEWFDSVSSGLSNLDLYQCGDNVFLGLMKVNAIMSEFAIFAQLKHNPKRCIIRKVYAKDENNKWISGSGLDLYAKMFIDSCS